MDICYRPKPPFAACLLVLFCVALISPNSVADDRQVTVLGALTCAEWIQGRKDEAEDKKMLSGLTVLLANRWLLGFLSGLNANDASPKDLLRTVNADTTTLWADKYCNKNPKSSLFEAGVQLLEELKKIEANPSSK